MCARAHISIYQCRFNGFVAKKNANANDANNNSRALNRKERSCVLNSAAHKTYNITLITFIFALDN